jgi:hypothetical protein
MNGRETEPIPMAVRCAFYGRMIVAIAGSNPAEGMVVRHLCLMCVAWVAASVKS